MVLLFITLGAVYFHYAAGDKLDRMAPAIIFSLLLCTRLIIYYQGKRSNANTKTERTKDIKNETKNTQEKTADEKPAGKKKSSDEKKKK